MSDEVKGSASHIINQIYLLQNADQQKFKEAKEALLVALDKIKPHLSSDDQSLIENFTSSLTGRVQPLDAKAREELNLSAILTLFQAKLLGVPLPKLPNQPPSNLTFPLSPPETESASSPQQSQRNQPDYYRTIRHIAIENSIDEGELREKVDTLSEEKRAIGCKILQYVSGTNKQGLFALIDQIGQLSEDQAKSVAKRVEEGWPDSRRPEFIQDAIRVTLEVGKIEVAFPQQKEEFAVEVHKAMSHLPETDRRSWIEKFIDAIASFFSSDVNDGEILEKFLGSQDRERVHAALLKDLEELEKKNLEEAKNYAKMLQDHQKEYQIRANDPIQRKIEEILRLPQ